MPSTYPTTDELQAMNLWQKLHLVMQHTGYVQKTGYNSAQRYPFAKAEDFIAAVRNEVIRARLAISGSGAISSAVVATQPTKSGGSQLVTEVMAKYRLWNIDNPSEFIEETAVGQGADALDKGAYKAQTGALKYFLASCFMLATGEDPESSQLDYNAVMGQADAEAARRDAAKRVFMDKMGDWSDLDASATHAGLMAALAEFQRSAPEATLAVLLNDAGVSDSDKAVLRERFLEAGKVGA